jgi:hypothetical protein
MGMQVSLCTVVYCRTTEAPGEKDEYDDQCNNYRMNFRKIFPPANALYNLPTIQRTMP